MSPPFYMFHRYVIDFQAGEPTPRDFTSYCLLYFYAGE